MKLLSLATDNFKVLSGQRYFEFHPGITGISGVNGVGKSTLINAIAFAFYGSEVLKSTTPDIPTWGEKKTNVVVTFELDGDTYICSRSLTTAALARCATEGEARIIKAEGRDPVTTAMTELLGIDKDGFLVSVFARQNELLYLSSEPDKRMRTILKLLRISQITKAVKLVRDEANVQRRELSIMRSQQKNVDDLNAQADKLGEQLDVSRASEVAVERLLSEAQEEVRKLEDNQTAYQSLMNEYQSLSSSVYAALADLSAQKNVLTRQLSELKDKCPTCGRPFDNREHIERERYKIQKKIDDLEIERDHVHFETDEQLHDMHAQIAEQSQTAGLLQIENKRIAELTGKRSFLISQGVELEKQIEAVHYALQTAKNSQSQMKAHEKSIAAQEQTANLLQSMRERLIGRIIPFLNERSSQLVDQMTDGKYSEVRLTPDYDIQFRNAQGDLKNFANLSGGEQVVFGLALRLAIADLRADSIGCLFLDEVLSNLSSEDGRDEQVWQAIENLSARYQQVFMITHVSAFKDRAEHTIVLS